MSTSLRKTCFASFVIALISVSAVWTGFSGLSPVSAQTSTTEAERAKLQARLDQVEKEIAAQTALLNSKQKETASIQRDVDILTAKIKRARLNIEAKTLEIQRLGGNINKKETLIGDLTAKGEREIASLAELLRKTREMDELSIAEVALSNGSISDLHNDLEAFFYIHDSLNHSYNTVKQTKSQTEQEKSELVTRRNAELNARKVIEQEKKNIERDEAEKKRLLGLSKQEEQAYKTVISTRQQEKQAILDALFRLRDAKNISFGQAYELAKVVERGTGVRPAFLLAIITQESNLGQNVGTCNRPGDPATKHWTQIMKPERDQGPFLQITKELGINPEGLPLSCPIGGGWGGAMGPAQFIPSTWIMYKDRVGRVTGNVPPNPWNPQDAFAASGTFLADLGANARTYSAEHTAAARYYAGGRWATAGQAYANSVMRHAANYQSQIDILAN